MKATSDRSAVFSLFVLGSLLFAAGCESLNLRRHSRRQETDEDVALASASTPKEEVETDKILDVQSEPSSPRKFFRGSQLPSGLSDQSREIERDLGVH